MGAMKEGEEWDGLINQRWASLLQLEGGGMELGLERSKNGVPEGTWCISAHEGSEH